MVEVEFWIADNITEAEWRVDGDAADELMEYAIAHPCRNCSEGGAVVLHVTWAEAA